MDEMTHTKRSASTQDDNMQRQSHNLDNPTKKIKYSPTPRHSSMNDFLNINDYENDSHHSGWKTRTNGETDSSLTGYSEDQASNSTNTSLSTSATSYGPYSDHSSNSHYEDSPLKLDSFHNEWLHAEAQKVVQVANANSIFDIATELDFTPRRLGSRMSTSRLRQRPSRLDLLDNDHYTCFSDMMTPIRSSPHTMMQDSPTPTVSSCGNKSKSLVFVGDYFSPSKSHKPGPELTTMVKSNNNNNDWRCASCYCKLSGSRDRLKNEKYEIVLCQSCAASECGAKIEQIGCTDNRQEQQQQQDNSPYPISSAQLALLLMHHEEAIAGGGGIGSCVKSEWLKAIRHKVRWRWRVRGLLPASISSANETTLS